MKMNNQQPKFYDTDKRYNQYSAYLKEIFNTKVYKITLDAGFNCPNRDGTLSHQGCIFCDASGSYSQAQPSELSVKEQLFLGVENLKNSKFKAKKFISYFQAYTNTYKPIVELKEIYAQGLSHKDVVGISIGTRPDCVDEEKLDLIASYTQNYNTWIEYGLQTIHDKTLSFINRGHDFECFLKAYKQTKERNINTCAHVILGLPNETRDDMMQTAKTLAELKVDGVKLHLLCAMKGTKLAQIYENGGYTPLSEDEYINLVCDFLELLPQSTIIQRLAGNGLVGQTIAPKWIQKKFEILNKIDREFINRNSWQGKLFIE